MNKNFLKFLKFLILGLCWLLLSPLFVCLAYKWKVLKKRSRIILFLLSPLMLLLYAVIVLFVIVGYSDYQRKYKFLNTDVLEEITKVTFPSFEIVEYHKGAMSFNGDYSDKIVIKMDDESMESVYDSIESLIIKGDQHWRLEDDKYVFGIVWGNGLPAPNGLDNDENIMLSMSIMKGSSIINMTSGTW